ncbi:Rieske (2Fe-2S) protein [Mycolicibacterium mengxianglii]|uniref:hypothetical protein n=1 Tax=Mycolicibacterium mengxianglii TaxID=2736649 RepID=UPI0018EEEB34|nr:hypothetical protein [Mycolicibacterium mengxianglii]
MKGAGAPRNLMLQPASAGRHSSADPTDWTDTWVCVGLAEQLTEVGAVLPATIGYHAAHVRRTADGLVAAINARPFGGCMSIPVHCGSTQNVACPHRACAFSADGDVLDSATDPGGRARAEFVGDGRRTITLPLAQWSSLLFVNVTMDRPAPLPMAQTCVPDDLVALAAGSTVVSGGWLVTPQRVACAVADALGAGDADVDAPTPNLAVLRHGADTFVALSRPAGHTRSTVVWALLGPPGSTPGIDSQVITGRLWSISRRS